MSDVPCIDGFRIIWLLNEVVLTVETTLGSLQKTEDQDVARNIETFVETVKWSGITDEKLELLLGEVRQLARKRLQNNRDVVLNWGLVMLWSRFEALIEDILLLFFKTDERAFLSWAGETSVVFADLQNAGTVDDVKVKYFTKAIKKFTDEPITKRVELLAKKLNTREEVLFSKKNCNEKIKTQLGNWGSATLKSISDQRNKIVHDQQIPVGNIDELRNSEVVLERFLLNVVAIVGDKLNMPVLIQHIVLPKLV